ncbi:MAG: hypothetical protein K8H87_02715 [Pseudorhodoplanes sp.]|nr:hypothetical protein [Pseudorhodoplanes sp.]
MTERSVVLKIAAGGVEVEYQGDIDLLRSQILPIAKEFLDAFGTQRATTSAGHKTSNNASGQTFELTTDTIATLLGASSGTELLIAASAHLQFAKGKSKFSRQELIDEMRSAPNHFKETFVNNLSQYLGRLTKVDRLRAVGGDMYALSSKEKSTLEAKLANAE